METHTFQPQVILLFKVFQTLIKTYDLNNQNPLMFFFKIKL